MALDEDLRVNRRRLLVSSGMAAAGLTVAGAWPAAGERLRLDGYPFGLGVASGEPRPAGVVLWTRLAPAPLEPDGGMPAASVRVRWMVASDPAMRRVLRRGEAVAEPRWGHSVHVEVGGLEPGREYYYAFEALGERSPVGRTKTAPRADAALGAVSFAVASCQHYEQGFFAAYRDMAEQDLDLVLHVGDYIYESAPREDRPRRHVNPEPHDLDGYRMRLAQYRSDPDLQAAHAAHPWVVTWDDHEVDNDYANDRSQDDDPAWEFLLRRAAAYQAYWEHMPLPVRMRPRGPDMRIYRRLRFGELAEFSVLDARQYRDDQPCDDNGVGRGQFVTCDENQDPGRSLLGTRQREWLLHGFRHTDARWNVLVQQMLMAQLDGEPGPGQRYWSDFWDGYAAERRTVLAAAHDAQVANPVSLGGDLHSFWVNDLHRDFDDPDSPVVGTEFLGTSISSELPAPYPEVLTGMVANNPHVHYFESRYRGYLRCTVTPDTWLSDLRVVDDVTDPGSAVRTLNRWAVEDGRPGAVPA